MLRQTRDAAEQRLYELMQHNIESLRLLVSKVAEFPEPLRMVRLGSDVLNMYTEPNFRDFWQRSDVVAYCEKHFRTVGDIARLNNVRVSFHPGRGAAVVAAGVSGTDGCAP